MKKLVMVDAIAQHLIRYVVEVEDNIDHALDEVVIRDGDHEFQEFSQRYLGQTIVSHREITTEEYLKIFNSDNAYLASWDAEKKLNYINRIDYGDNKNDTTDPCNEA